MYDYEKKFIIKEDEFNKTYRKELIKTWYCFILAIISLILGLNNFTMESNAIWFQRSGSLIVLFSLLTEYNHLKIKTLVNDVRIDYGNGKIMTRMENFKEKNLPPEYSDPQFNILIEPIIIITAILGTVIWGYGDLLYKYF